MGKYNASQNIRTPQNKNKNVAQYQLVQRTKRTSQQIETGGEINFKLIPTSSSTNNHHNLYDMNNQSDTNVDNINTPKLFAWSHEQRFLSHVSEPAGQCVYGARSYPISPKKWIWSFRAKIDAAMLRIGASPHRYNCRLIVSKVEEWVNGDGNCRTS